MSLVRTSLSGLSFTGLGTLVAGSMNDDFCFFPDLAIFPDLRGGSLKVSPDPGILEETFCELEGSLSKYKLSKSTMLEDSVSGIGQARYWQVTVPLRSFTVLDARFTTTVPVRAINTRLVVCLFRACPRFSRSQYGVGRGQA